MATTRTRSRESGLKGPLGRQVVAGHRNETNRQELTSGKGGSMRPYPAPDNRTSVARSGTTRSGLTLADGLAPEPALP